MALHGQEIHHEGTTKFGERHRAINVLAYKLTQFSHFMPPVKYCSISKTALWRKYKDENWEERLRQYSYEFVTFKRKEMHFWREGDTIMALITKHYNPKDTQTIVRMLREKFPNGDIIWDIDHDAPEQQLPLPLSAENEKD